MEEQQDPFNAQDSITKIPGVGALLGMSWQIYKSRIGVLLGIMAVPVIASLLIVFLLPLFNRSSSLIVVLLSLALYFIVTFWSQVSLYYAIKEREQKIGIQESFRKGWHKMASFLWVSFLAGSITMAGFFLFVIPGIIFAVWFSLALYVLVAEDLKGMNALFRSKQLVSGNWGGVFWRFFVVGLIIFAAIFLISLFLSLLGIFLEDSFLQNLIAFFITPLMVAYYFLIYEALKKTKEGVPFEPPAEGTKIKYILIGALGILLSIGCFALLVLAPLGGARQRANDGRVIADMSQIRTAATILEWEDGGYDKITSDPSIEALCEDIEDHSVNKEKPTIHQSKDAYCAYIELSDGYYCIDSTLHARSTSAYPGESGYCDGLTYVCP